MSRLLATILLLASVSGASVGTASARSDVDVDVKGSNVDVEVVVTQRDDEDDVEDGGYDDYPPAPRIRPYRVQYCLTPMGASPMVVAQYPGSPCWVPSPYGPVWGQVSN